MQPQYLVLILFALPLLSSARWDDFAHKFTDICIKGRVTCGGGAVAGGKEIELMDEDLFKDDLIFSVKTEADGTFEGCGQAKDFLTAPDPEFYLAFYNTCNRTCARFNFGDLPKNDDGSISANLEDIDVNGGDEYVEITGC